MRVLVLPNVMKQIYVFLLLLSTQVYGQKLDLKEYMNSTEELMKSERLSHHRLQAREMTGGYANASNNFDVHYYRCEWNVDPAINYINGKVTSLFTITNSANTIIFDLDHTLTVDSVLYHNNKISFVQGANETISISFPANIAAGQSDSVSIFYQGTPTGSGFGSFIQTNHAGTPVIWTLSEPYGARDWWPCKNGLSDKADSIDVYVTYPNSYVSTSNGVLQSRIVNGGNQTDWYKHRYPIATYLVAFEVTNFQVLTDTIQVNNYVLPFIQHGYPESINNFIANAFKLKRTVRLYTKAVGDYPFKNEQYGQTQFGWGGGMEHQTNSFVTTPQEAVATHELAHQWYGDKVTTGSWQHIWLNEGFATFFASYYLENTYDHATVLANYAGLLNVIVSQPNGSVFVDDTTNVNRIFNGRLTYYKGMYLLRMLRLRLGDSLFFQGLRNYHTDPRLAYNFALTEDLQKHLEAVSGQKLDEFFKDWFYGQGYPSYQLQWISLGNGWIKTSMSQTTSHPSVDFFENPVPVVFKNGAEEKTITIDHIKNNQINYINLGFNPDTALIDPDLWLISKDNSVSKLVDNNTVVGIEVFPNPVGDQFNIFIHNVQQDQAEMAIYNSIGQLMLKRNIPLANGYGFDQVNSSKFSRGVYILKVTAGTSIKLVKRILK
ncbi:MAG: peptidase M1 [Bacteroidetes bacterium]|nr:MAG: peptidase M1 [Bacteroidota bacterium]